MTFNLASDDTSHGCSRLKRDVTVAELLARLNCIMSESMRRSLRWPKAPNALGTALRRMASDFRAAGIEIQFIRANLRGRHVVSLICASEVRKRPSVTVSGRQ